MKIEVRKEPYTITDGNGGRLYARVVNIPDIGSNGKRKLRVVYQDRSSNRGPYRKELHTVTIPAFRKLVDAVQE